MKYLLGLDNGGTYIKAAIYTDKGKCVSSAKVRNEMLHPREGWAEYNLEDLWERNCLCIREVLKKSGIDPLQIAAVGISAQGCGIYPLGENGKIVCNAVSSSDSRGVLIENKWKKDGTAGLVAPYYGHDPWGSYASVIMAWFKQYQPEIYDRICHIFSMKGFLGYQLTGNMIDGVGCMSSSGFMDIRTGKYDRKITEICGIPECFSKLPEVKRDDEVIGVVSAKAAAECGLGEGTMVAAGSHDITACAIAMGGIHNGDAMTITGTCSINFVLKDRPADPGASEIFALDNLYVLEASCASGSAGELEWVIDALYSNRDCPRGELYEAVNREAKEADPLSGGVIFVPQIHGRGGMPQARGAWIGFGEANTRSDLLRSVLEGVAYFHRTQLEYLYPYGKPERLRLSGGAVNSELWTQIFADVMNIPLIVIRGEEQGAKGAAILAAAAAGIYSSLEDAIQAMGDQSELIYPDEKNSRQYEMGFRRYCQVIKQTDGLWERS